ncbi:hypothetical protein, partial [Lactococcus petauri]|uniref:hypothetical protein n=1 Tax=Lactococcus petauri TaxID=1940789 RepID=UPI0032B41B6F
ARKKVFDFGDAYYDSNLTLAVSKSNEDIKKWEDLKGKQVGAKVPFLAPTCFPFRSSHFLMSSFDLETASVKFES